MKTKEIDGKNTGVCEICERPFSVGEKFVIHTITLTAKKTINFYGLDVPLAEEDLTKVDEHQKFFHTKCLPDDVKRALNNLSQEDRVKAYKYLHYTLGCHL